MAAGKTAADGSTVEPAVHMEPQGIATARTGSQTAMCAAVCAGACKV